MCWDGKLLRSPTLNQLIEKNCKPFLFTGHGHYGLCGYPNAMSGPKLPQGLNISDPHNLAATFYLRGLLNTSILRSTPNNTSYPEGSLQLWASSISAAVYVLHREKPSWGVHSICSPWPRNSNLVTVEQGTFHHSSTLPAISMDFKR